MTAEQQQIIYDWLSQEHEAVYKTAKDAHESGLRNRAALLFDRSDVIGWLIQELENQRGKHG